MLSLGADCWVEANDDRETFTLFSENEPSPRLVDELIAYEHELQASAAAPREILRFPAHASGYSWFLVWLLALLFVYRWQDIDPSIVELGASSSIGFWREGEWWRPFTSLFLHGDILHLVGNLAGGLFFGLWVSRSIGAWLGWCLILLSGAVGNAITSGLMLPEPFQSIGASTAVFAGLGILVGIGFAHAMRQSAQRSLMRLTVPVLAGLVLLGWFGSGSPDGKTDVLGHVIGFSVGIPVGWACGWWQQPKREKTALS